MILLLLLCSIPQTEHIYVDVIEYNTFLDDQGGFIFDQWLFYRHGYNPYRKKYRYDIYDWRLAKLTQEIPYEEWKQKTKIWREEFKKDFPEIEAIPEFMPDLKYWPISFKNDRYTLIFKDHKNKDKTTVIIAPLLVLTITHYDPELVEREFLPEAKRIRIKKEEGLLQFFQGLIK